MRVVIDNYKNKEVNIVCSNCKSILAIVQADVRFIGSQMDPTYGVTCPCCNKTAVLESNPFIDIREYMFGR